MNMRETAGERGQDGMGQGLKPAAVGLAIGGPVPAQNGPAERPATPKFSEEERILLQNLAGGSSIKEISGQLRLSKGNLYRLLGDLRRKTGTVDDLALSVWVLRNLGGRGGDCRSASR
jgi:DNA-binding NarL/FixJ family response regulator